MENVAGLMNYQGVVKTARYAHEQSKAVTTAAFELWTHAEYLQKHQGHGGIGERDLEARLDEALNQTGELLETLEGFKGLIG